MQWLTGMKIQNKVVFISGANRGIGKALVEAALKAGAKKVYAAARKIESLPQWKDSRIVAISLDVTNAQSVANAAKQAADTDLLINNAGTLTHGSILESSLSDLRKDMDTNYYGTIQMLQAFAPALIQKGSTAIANLLSVVSFASFPANCGYCASKAALFSATQALRSDLKKEGIEVYGIFPGPIDTEMAKDIPLQKFSAQETAQNIIDGIAAGTEDIFPDPYSQQVGELWHKDPKDLERKMAQAA